MEMGRKRRRFTDKFKAKVAVDAIKGVKTLAELASEHLKTLRMTRHIFIMKTTV